jgi:hypothetical protein
MTYFFFATIDNSARGTAGYNVIQAIDFIAEREAKIQDTRCAETA